MSKKTKTYIISIIIPLAIGGLSALLTKNNMDINNDVNMPPLSPPSFLFPIVWSILYVLMGISSARVYLKIEENRENSERGLFFYIISLILNFFWSLFFFNKRAFLFSFVWLVLLICSIILTIVNYKKADKIAFWLQIPYLLWTLFAAYLNFMIYILNA